jgi:hypothetical protein
MTLCWDRSGRDDSGGRRLGIFEWGPEVYKVSARSSCGSPPPVCSPGPGYLGLARIINGTHRTQGMLHPNDASSEGQSVRELLFGDISAGDTS